MSYLSKMLSVWISLTFWYLVKDKNLYPIYLFTERQILRLVQIESICRRQHKYNLKTEILTGMG